MVKICSKKQWNDTGINLEKNCHYEYKATGIWIDWFIKCNANGFHPVINLLMDFVVNIIANPVRRIMRKNRIQKRISSARWFQLIGEVKQNESHNESYIVKLGIKGDFKPSVSGRLYVYANDDLHFYGNNREYIELEINLMKSS